jgi:hypothetical protein
VARAAEFEQTFFLQRESPHRPATASLLSSIENYFGLPLPCKEERPISEIGQKDKTEQATTCSKKLDGFAYLFLENRVGGKNGRKTTLPVYLLAVGFSIGHPLKVKQNPRKPRILLWTNPTIFDK